MNNKKLRKILYPCAVLVLLVMGAFLWVETNKPMEEKVFVINGQQETVFEFTTKTEHPKALHIRFEGILDCDGILVVKENGEGNTIRIRRSFPVKSGDLKGREVLQTNWTNREMVLEFKTKDCVASDVKIMVEVEG